MHRSGAARRSARFRRIFRRRRRRQAEARPRYRETLRPGPVAGQITRNRRAVEPAAQKGARLCTGNRGHRRPDTVPQAVAHLLGTGPVIAVGEFGICGLPIERPRHRAVAEMGILSGLELFDILENRCRSRADIKIEIIEQCLTGNIRVERRMTADSPRIGCKDKCPGRGCCKRHLLDTDTIDSDQRFMPGGIDDRKRRRTADNIEQRYSLVAPGFDKGRCAALRDRTLPVFFAAPPRPAVNDGKDIPGAVHGNVGRPALRADTGSGNRFRLPCRSFMRMSGIEHPGDDIGGRKLVNVVARPTRAGPSDESRQTSTSSGTGWLRKAVGLAVSP